MLNEIIAAQKTSVTHYKKALPFNELLPILKTSNKDFYAALKKNHPAFILECKQRSPSEGVLLAEYPIGSLIEKYAKHADAISVLTNQTYFGGSYNHLKLASISTSKPILCKDIIVDPYQVALARRYGADAVLLMLSVISDDEYLACKKVADDLNMAILTEVHTESEVQRAINLNAKIIGINHRCLHTMTLDMDRVYQLSPLFPKNALIIAASGIHSFSQIQQLNPYVNGFLIGSSLSKSANVELTLRKLVYGNIKVCGLTQTQDVQSAFDLGATIAGFNFAPHSPRKISLDTALQIKVPPMDYVGVFASQDIEYVSYVASKLKLYAVQLHGNETPEYIQSLRKHLDNECQIHLAIDGTNDIPLTLPNGVDKLLIDASLKGGTGHTFDWSKLIHHPLLSNIILAGGICLNNVKQAQALGVWGLDVNSGVESAPGLKDPHKMQALFNHLKSKDTI